MLDVSACLQHSTVVFFFFFFFFHITINVLSALLNKAFLLSSLPTLLLLLIIPTCKIFAIVTAGSKTEWINHRYKQFITVINNIYSVNLTLLKMTMSVGWNLNESPHLFSKYIFPCLSKISILHQNMLNCQNTLTVHTQVEDLYSRYIDGYDTRQFYPSCTACTRIASLSGSSRQNKACLRLHHFNHILPMEWMIEWMNV